MHGKTCRQRKNKKPALVGGSAGEGLQFKSKEAKARYQRRVTRVKDAIQLKKTPDRVPVFPFGTFFMPQLGGANYKEAMYDITKLNNAMKKYLDEFIPYYYLGDYYRSWRSPGKTGLQAVQMAGIQPAR